MKKVMWRIDCGFVGAIHEGEFEVDDDATDREISDLVDEQVYDHIELCWTVENVGGQDESRPSRSRQ
jgi:hypothetical protein